MMKIRKILLSGCLVATLCSCGGSQNENLNLTLSKDALFDKVKRCLGRSGYRLYVWRSYRVPLSVYYDSGFDSDALGTG